MDALQRGILDSREEDKYGYYLHGPGARGEYTTFKDKGSGAMGQDQEVRAIATLENVYLVVYGYCVTDGRLSMMSGDTRGAEGGNLPQVHSPIVEENINEADIRALVREGQRGGRRAVFLQLLLDVHFDSFQRVTQAEAEALAAAKAAAPAARAAAAGEAERALDAEVELEGGHEAQRALLATLATARAAAAAAAAPRDRPEQPTAGEGGASGGTELRGDVEEKEALERAMRESAGAFADEAQRRRRAGR